MVPSLLLHSTFIVLVLCQCCHQAHQFLYFAGLLCTKTPWHNWRRRLSSEAAWHHLEVNKNTLFLITTVVITGYNPLINNLGVQWNLNNFLSLYQTPVSVGVCVYVYIYSRSSSFTLQKLKMSFPPSSSVIRLQMSNLCRDCFRHRWDFWWHFKENFVSQWDKTPLIISDGISSSFRWKLRIAGLRPEHLRSLAHSELKLIKQLSSGKCMNRVICLRENMARKQGRVVSCSWFLWSSSASLTRTPYSCL